MQLAIVLLEIHCSADCGNVKNGRFFFLVIFQLDDELRWKMELQFILNDESMEEREFFSCCFMRDVEKRPELKEDRLG